MPYKSWDELKKSGKELAADRVQMLREAFAEAAQDPEFIAESKKAKIEISYISPEEVLKMFNGLLVLRPVNNFT